MQPSPAETTLTAQERQAATTLLEESITALHAAAAGLDDQAWRARPAPTVWSPGDIVEHLVKSEHAVYQLVTMIW